VSGLEAALDAHPDTGAILAEPMQAVGGLAPPKIWWERVDALRRTRGLLLVLDEIQTGLGRTGTMFAAEHYGLAPDIMTLAKGLSGGVGSLGAVLCTAEVAARFSGATSPTSAANAVSCAAGLSLLRVIQDERLCENAAAMGALLAAQVIALDRPEIGDVRFHGLLGGIELVHDREHKTPWTKAEIRGLKDALLARGVIVTATGPLGNVIRVQPPLSVSPGEIDLFVALFGEALAGRRSGIQ
jgi:4-aminobutyrate aminotransferase-like enzyme